MKRWKKDIKSQKQIFAAPLSSITFNFKLIALVVLVNYYYIIITKRRNEWRNKSEKGRVACASFEWDCRSLPSCSSKGICWGMFYSFLFSFSFFFYVLFLLFSLFFFISLLYVLFYKALCSFSFIFFDFFFFFLLIFHLCYERK